MRYTRWVVCLDDRVGADAGQLVPFQHIPFLRGGKKTTHRPVKGVNIWRISSYYVTKSTRYNLSVTFTMGRVICLDDRVGRRSSRTVSTYNVFLWWPKKTTHHPSIGLNIWKIFSYHVTKSTRYDLSVTFAMGRVICLDDRIGRRPTRTVLTYTVFSWMIQKRPITLV